LSARWLPNGRQLLSISACYRWALTLPALCKSDSQQKLSQAPLSDEALTT
jgi:hypothetical protein